MLTDIIISRTVFWGLAHKGLAMFEYLRFLSETIGVHRVSSVYTQAGGFFAI